MIQFGVKGTIVKNNLSTTAIRYSKTFALLSALLVLATAPLKAELSVVTTTSIIANTAAEIAGSDATISALMGAGVDPHLYKGSPGDLRKLTQANLILHNGLHLEGKIAEVLSSLAKRRPVVAVTDEIPPELLLRASHSSDTVDPHVWLNAALWSYAARRIRDALIAQDPTHEAGYRSRFDLFNERLSKLHSWTQQRIATIPRQQRLLVTSHDAFGYFGKAYDLEVLAIQGVNTDSDASLRDVNAIIEVVVNRSIPAVFIESSISPRTIEALAQGVRSKGKRIAIGGELLSDALGTPQTPQGTYVGMMEHNVNTITTALSQGNL